MTCWLPTAIPERPAAIFSTRSSIMPSRIWRLFTALSKALRSSNSVADSDASYDGIFYATTSGTPLVEKVERRRYDRLREVLGTEGLASADLHET
jgi:hypothetical protein